MNDLKNFKELDISKLQFNPFKKIGTQWGLVTAGNSDKFNTMTISWGSFGVMWGKNVVFTFLRPQRYTKEFVDKESTFTLSFFDEEYRKSLNYLGTISGRDINKIADSNLTPTFLDGTPCFEEANMVLVCRKLFAQELTPENFLDISLDFKWYPNKDYHTMYVSEIQKVYVKE